MSAARIEQLLEAARWLRLSGDVDGAKKLYEQVLALDPENAAAQEFLSGQTHTTQAIPDQPVARVNPFRRTDPKGMAAVPRLAGLESDWGASLPSGPGVVPEAKPPEAQPDAGDAAFELSWEDSPLEPEPPLAPAHDALDDLLSASPVEQRSTARFGEGALSASAWDAGWDLEGDGPPLVAEPVMDVSSEFASADPLELVAESALLTSPSATVGAQPRGSPEHEEALTLIQGARDLISLDDHSGAMDLLLKAEQLAPDDPEVRRLKEESEQTLVTMFESKLGELRQTPQVRLGQDEIIWLNLDHRAGFVLAQIDGSVTFDDLFALSGMSRFDTARILSQLVEEGVISTGG